MIARGRGRSLLGAITLPGDHRKNKSISEFGKSVFLHRTKKYQRLGFTACVDSESHHLFVKNLNDIVSFDCTGRELFQMKGLNVG